MAKRTPLVCQHLENISRDALGKYQKLIREYVRHRHGVYALYRREKLYYVGLASNLRMRLSHHLRDRHGESWDRFSVYLTIGDSHLRELEALILRIVKPKGNNQRGKFAQSEDLKRRFGRNVRETHRKELKDLIGVREVIPKKIKRDGHASGRSSDIVKILKGKAYRLRRRYKGKLYKARLRKDGTVLYNSKIYRSPTAVGRLICSHPVNAWKFWEYERAPGDWLLLDRLRR